MPPMAYARSRRKRIYDINLTSKISCQTPFHTCLTTKRGKNQGTKSPQTVMNFPQIPKAKKL